MISFDASIDFLDDDLLKLSRIGCLHGLVLVEVVHVVACGKHYGIQHILLYPKVFLVHGFIVVVALFV